MADYPGVSREELIARLQALEARTAASELRNRRQAAETQRALVARREGEERLRAILDTAVEAIITIDERGIIESFNAAAQKTFGYSAAEIVGHNVRELMPAPDRDSHDGYISNYLRTGHARIIGIGREVVGLRKDGSLFPMDLSVSEVRLEGRRLFTGFVRDITERKRLEKEVLEISEREQRGVGHTLHDGLCQHLAAIELMSQVLEQNLRKKSKPAAAQAGKIARHVRDAIAQTRMLARGLSPVSIESDGLISALRELADNITTLFHVNCRFDCSVPFAIPDNTTSTHLYRIAQEAINNAIKHAKSRDVTIRLRRDGLSAQLLIIDNGVGFPKAGPKNRGMGLQIMKYRAGIIGAALEIRPANGKGTAVICTFRL